MKSKSKKQVRGEVDYITSFQFKNFYSCSCNCCDRRTAILVLTGLKNAKLLQLCSGRLRHAKWTQNDDNKRAERGERFHEFANLFSFGLTNELLKENLRHPRVWPPCKHFTTVSSLPRVLQNVQPPFSPPSDSAKRELGPSRLAFEAWPMDSAHSYWQHYFQRARVPAKR